MNPISFIAIYIVIWWLCLFLILPIGAHSQADSETVVSGSEPGAPAILRLWPKLLATTILSIIVQALLIWGLTNPFLQEYWR